MRETLLGKFNQILSFGISDKHSNEEQRKIRLTNAFAIFNATSGAILASFLYKASFNPQILNLTIISTLLALCILLMSYAKKTLISKLGLISITISTIMILSQLLGAASGIHFALILSIGFSIILFTPKEKKYFYFTLPLPFIAFFLLRFSALNSLITPHSIPTDQLHLIHTVIVFLAFSLLTAVLLLSSKYLEKARAEAQLLALETIEQNEELEAQEEELRQNLEELQATQDALDDKNTLLKRKNTLIMSSITYAQNIQQAILPSADDMSRVFKEWFAIYRPKDVVSGDFYWMSYIEKKTFIAVVDCTGHGVPGAFMSMIGSTLLNEIINEKHIFAVDQILDTLHYKVRTSLKQQFGHNQDGMDVCLCCLEPKGNEFKVEFAGAKRPLLYTHQQQLHKLQGDKQSIAGWSRDNRHFECQNLILQKGDCLYLSTDGFIDTPSPRRKTFGNRRFEKMITQYAHRSMSQQKSDFVQTLEDYQQNTEQRDDITLLGIRA